MTSLPQRRLGLDGPEVSAVGLGCMSISWGYFLDPQDETRLRAHAATRARARRHPLRHRVAVRPRPQRDARRPRAAQPAAGVLIASKCGLENHGAPRGTVRDGTAGDASAANARSRSRGSGSRCSTSTTCTASTPTCRSRRASARSPSSSREGKIRRARHLGVHRRRARARARDASCERAAERVLALDARDRSTT